uniref:DUF1573 domain-containing protein n=1 Tax=Mediterranea massiliensis TaxID=1841865 RepID=UPI0023F21399
QKGQSYCSQRGQSCLAKRVKVAWLFQQTAEFVLKNTGRHPLVIFDTYASCGCTRVEYDGKPARPGEGVVLRVTYKADNPGHS